MKVILGSLISVLILGAIGFLGFVCINTSSVNDTLKNEVYELRQEVKRLKEEKMKISNEFSDYKRENEDWFSNYIDLSIKCGANE